MREENVALECPYCKGTIYEPLSWFKKSYSTCPFCNNGLSAGQFAQVIADLEEAMDARIDELMTPAPPQGCACKASCR